MATKRKSNRIWSLALALLALGLTFCFFWNLGLSHEWLLWKFSRKYNSVIRHPSYTQRVRYYRKLGLLIGNGNHCDLFVGELRSYTGSRQQLLQHYAPQSYRSPVMGEQLPVEILFINKGKIEEGQVYHGEIGFDMPSPLETILNDANAISSPPKQLYIVYMFDPGYDPGLDIRCN